MQAPRSEAPTAPAAAILSPVGGPWNPVWRVTPASTAAVMTSAQAPFSFICLMASAARISSTAATAAQAGVTHPPGPWRRSRAPPAVKSRHVAPTDRVSVSLGSQATC